MTNPMTPLPLDFKWVEAPPGSEILDRAIDRLMLLIADEVEHKVPDAEREWDWDVASLKRVLASMAPNGEFYDSQSGGAQ